MTSGLNRNDMNWITRDCKERANITQLWQVINEYQAEVQRRDTGDEINDTEDNNQ